MRQFQVYFAFLLSIGCAVLNGQEFRSIDGSQNNFANPDWGSVGAEMLRIAPADYALGSGSIPGGINRPHPRTVSNALFAQENSVFDRQGFSDYVWAFGQFLDHDFSFVLDELSESLSMQIPMGDAVFDPDSSGLARIPMLRSQIVPGTGTSPQNPRQHANVISSFIDGSAVYGSDQHMADWLRSFEDGKLKVSQGNNLPWNTLSGEFDSPIDPSAPQMGDETGLNPRLLVAGDVRANENIVLAAMHTLFVREHNRMCDEIKAQHPDYSDEQLYQEARAWVAAYIQSIVYNEWLPTLGVFLDSYEGYDPFVNPSLFNEFSAAAFRLGHTLLNSEIPRIGADGVSVDDEPLLLRDLFFNPQLVLEPQGLDPLLRGLYLQMQQNMDNRVVDDVRNFLFFEPEPSVGGLDLAAININRGRERGIADFNTVRVHLGLTPYSAFDQISTDPDIVETLENLYGNVNNIDLWSGLLSEDQLSDCMVGETLGAILKLQFENLRDGDRFFYLNDDLFSEEEKERITNTTMGDIVLRNSGVSYVPENIFVARDFRDIQLEDVPLRQNDLALSASPNPFESEIALTIRSEELGDAQLIVYDPMGKVVYLEEFGLEQGVQVVRLQLPQDLQSGVYLGSIRRGASEETVTLLKK